MNASNRRVRPPATEPAPARRATSPSAAPTQAPSRWWTAIRTIFGVVLVAGASAAVAWAARRHILTSARFAVTDVQVLGESLRAPDAIAAESGIAPGTNVFALDLDAARAKILADPWIADASLARRLPGTIVVNVVERHAAALVAMGDTLLATSDGEPFKKLEAGDPIDLPLVTGLSTERFAADRDGATRTVRRAIDLALEYEHGVLSRRAPLEEVHVDADGSFTLVVGRSATQLVLGAPPFRRKLEQAGRVVAELERRGAKADAIMLDNEARPERVVVRMR